MSASIASADHSHYMQLSAVGQNLFDLSLAELSEIPVNTTSFFPEPQKVTASTVSVVERDEWDYRGARHIADAVEHLPGTFVMPFRFGANAIAVRGFASSALPRGLSVLWDGVPLTGFSNGAAQVSVPGIDLGVLDDIEMVRGPASALYGSDAFHGVLALHTDASDEIPRADMRLGSDNYYAASGRVGANLGESGRSTIFLASSGQGDQDRQYQYTDPVSGNQANGWREHRYETQTGVVKVNSVPDAAISYRWGLYWNHFMADGFPGPGRVQTPGTSALADRDWSGSDTDFLMTNGALGMDLPAGVKAELNAYWWRADAFQHTGVARANGTLGENQVEVGDTRTGTSLVFKQAVNRWHTQWALALGHDRMRVHEGYTTGLAADGSVLFASGDRFDGQQRHISSLVLALKTGFLNDKLRLVYGGRVDDYSDFGLQTSPRLGIIFLPTADWTHKVLYGNAFRAPTAFELYGVGNLKGNPDLQPETVNTLEWVTQKTSRFWTAGVTLYQSRWQDSIIRAPSADPSFQLEFRNSETNLSRGVEASFNFKASQWLADVSASWTRSENLTHDLEYGAFPRAIVDAGIGYQTLNGLRIYMNNRLHFDVDEGISQSGQDVDELDTYWRTNLYVSQNMTGNLKLSLAIRNLFNRENALPSLFNAENGVPDDRFSISAGLHLRFQ